MGRGREAGHVHADLGDDHRGGGGSDPGDLSQAGHRLRERDQLLLGSLLHSLDVSAERWFSQRSQRLLQTRHGDMACGELTRGQAPLGAERERIQLCGGDLA